MKFDELSKVYRQRKKEPVVPMCVRTVFLKRAEKKTTQTIVMVKLLRMPRVVQRRVRPHQDRIVTVHKSYCVEDYYYFMV